MLWKISAKLLIMKTFSNDLKKMSKYNKKHDKGWGWFVHPNSSVNTKLNAGNVPLNNAIFNANMGSTTDSTSGNVAVAE